MRTWLRGKFTLLFMTCAVLLAIPAIVFADDLRNDIDSSFDADFEELGLLAGGTSHDVNIVLQTQGSDGDNGCNLDGTEKIQVQAVSSSSAASVKWAATGNDKVEFLGCGAPSSRDLTVTPGSSSGTANVTFKITSTGATESTTTPGVWTVTSTGGGTYDVRTAQFKVNVTTPNTPPTVSVTGVEHGATYDKGAVPDAGCLVTDTEDGLNASTTAATLTTDSTGLDSDGLGLETVECSYTDGGGATETASATYTIQDPSAPVITKTVTGQQGNNGWYTGDVNVDWTVSDPQSPNSLTTNGCADFSVTSDQGEQTYTCSATSSGGGPVTDSVTIKRDATDPTINHTLSPAANGAGWNNTDVLVDYSCSDATSEVASCGPDETLAEGANQSSTGNATDNAGNTASDTVSNIDIDKTNPNVNCGSADGNWHASDVSIACTASDVLSGLAASGDANFNLTTSVATGTETSTASTNSRNVLDNADNSTTAGPITGIKVDKKAPTFDACPTAGPFTQGSGLHSVSINANDGGSGMDNTNSTLSSDVDSGIIGAKSVTFTAKDNVGNTDTKVCSYDVDYNFSGFFQPVDNKDTSGNYILNKAKAGSVVPVKFSLGSDQGLNVLASGYPQTASIPCTASSSDAVEEYGTGNVSSFKYDPVANQYIYNWKTDTKWAGTCRQLVVKLADDTYHRANFNFFK